MQVLKHVTKYKTAAFCHVKLIRESLLDFCCGVQVSLLSPVTPKSLELETHFIVC